MAWFALARVLFIAAVAYAAAVLHPLHLAVAANIGFALGLAVLVVIFESRLGETAVTRILGALIGCAIGLGIARTIGAGLFWADSGDRQVEFLHSFVLLVLPYLGLVLGAKHGEWLEPARLISLFRAAGPQRRYKILDTSVIIDGRIADVCETGFIDGTLVIPQFVLKELQLVADSPDSLKRNRGRRGLDILQRIQKTSGVEVSISDMDFPDIREVDLKAGTIRTVIGTGQRGDGPESDPLRCALSRPHGVLVDARDVLYVADSEAHRIRTVVSA